MARNTKTDVSRKLHALVELSEAFSGIFPHLSAVLGDENEFLGLNVKVRADGTSLAVVKSVGSDGTPMVAFGVGYGYFGCLLAADATIQGGHWKVDKFAQ